MSTLTIKQIKQEIKDKYAAIPEAQIAPGMFLDTIGYKYITILDIHETTTKTKVEIVDFYDQYCVCN